MLLELSIRNFAIVDQVTVRWAPGLNVLTGETGAGKSILIDAVSALMGSRMGADWVRTGGSLLLTARLDVLAGDLKLFLHRLPLCYGNIHLISRRQKINIPIDIRSGA